MDFIKIDTKKLKIAGSSFLKIAYAILIGLVFIVLNLFLLVLSSPDLLFYIFLCCFSYIIIIYYILKNLIIAGRNLKNSELRDLQRIRNIIGEPIQIENLQVSQYDLNVEKQSVELNWDTAYELCDQLNFDEKGSSYYELSKVAGTNWRLPTKDELDLLYTNKDKIGNFTDGIYWSSTMYEGKAIPAVWHQCFRDGSQSPSNKYHSFYVRGIRGVTIDLEDIP